MAVTQSSTFDLVYDGCFHIVDSVGLLHVRQQHSFMSCGFSITSQIAVFDMHYFRAESTSCFISLSLFFYHNHPSSDFSYDEHVKSSLCLSLFNTDAFDLLPPDRRDNETSQTFPRDTDTDK